jgi:hypothetical protein
MGIFRLTTHNIRVNWLHALFLIQLLHFSLRIIFMNFVVIKKPVTYFNVYFTKLLTELQATFHSYKKLTSHKKPPFSIPRIYKSQASFSTAFFHFTASRLLHLHLVIYDSVDKYYPRSPVYRVSENYCWYFIGYVGHAVML